MTTTNNETPFNTTTNGVPFGNQVLNLVTYVMGGYDANKSIQENFTNIAAGALLTGTGKAIEAVTTQVVTPLLIMSINYAFIGAKAAYNNAPYAIEYANSTVKAISNGCYDAFYGNHSEIVAADLPGSMPTEAPSFES